MKLRVSPTFKPDIELMADVVAIVGRRGRGKTTTAVVLVEELARGRSRFCVADPTGAWWGLKSSKDGKSPGLPIVVMGGEHGDVPLEDTAGRIIADFVADPTNPSVVLDFFKFRKAAMVRFMADFLEELYQKNRERLHLVVDEAEQFAPQRIMGRGSKRDGDGSGPVPRMLGAMEDVVKLGRVRGLFPILITQRCASLNKNVLELSGMLVSHALTGPNDKKAVDGWVRGNTTERDLKEFHQTLAGLPRGSAWFWQPEADVFERVEVRDRTTFDSSATPGRGGSRATPKVVAEVDLESLKERIASTIERAKADDPKELRKRIAKLERDLKAKKPSKPEVKTVEVPVIKDAEVKRLEKLAERASAAVQTFTDSLDQLLNDVQQRSKEYDRAVAAASKPAPRASVSPAILQPRARETTASVESELTKYETKLLQAFAQRHPLELTVSQVAMLSGYSRKSSSFGESMKNLRRRGLIESGTTAERITDEGLAALGSDAPAIPTSPDERIALWRSKLSRSERSIFDAVVAAHPIGLTNEEISETTGYSMTSSSFSGSISSLKKADLVYAVSGALHASETLFE